MLRKQSFGRNRNAVNKPKTHHVYIISKILGGKNNIQSREKYPYCITEHTGPPKDIKLNAHVRSG